jgi:hypothetical protein
MGSSLSFVIANFFMEYLEEVTLSSVAYKLTCWIHYIDETFIIWPQGPEELNDFLHQLSNIHPNIQFTMETELSVHLPFLVIGIYRRPDGSLGHIVNRKSTYTNLYLNAESHYHPANTHFVLSTLVHRARAICNQECVPGELKFLHSMFKQNGYSDKQIHSAFNPLCRENALREDLTLVDFFRLSDHHLTALAGCY